MSKYCKVLGFVPSTQQTLFVRISRFCVTKSEWLDLPGPPFPPVNHPQFIGWDGEDKTDHILQDLAVWLPGIIHPSVY